MTGALQMMLASGVTPGALSGVVTLSGTRAGSSVQVALALFAAGGISPVGNVTQTAVPPNWYVPSPAPNMWATLVVDSGATPDAASSGPLTQTSNNPQWGWTQSAVGTTDSAGKIFIYADAAGTDRRATITYTAHVVRT